MQYLKYLLIVAVLSVLTACGSGPDRPGARSYDVDTALTAGLNGMTVTRDLHDKFILSLVRNTKLGGAWKFVSYDSNILQFKDKEPRRYNKVMVGPLANVMYCDWELKAINVGQTTLKMEYVSDDGSEVYETFEVTVNVVD